MEGTPEVFVLCMVPLWLRTTHLGNLSILRILTGRLPALLGQTYHSISPVMHIDNNEYFHVVISNSPAFLVLQHGQTVPARIALNRHTPDSNAVPAFTLVFQLSMILWPSVLLGPPPC